MQPQRKERRKKMIKRKLQLNQQRYIVSLLLFLSKNMQVFFVEWEPFFRHILANVKKSLSSGLKLNYR